MFQRLNLMGMSMNKKKIAVLQPTSIVYQSKQMTEVIDKINQLRNEDRAVLIIGETGTGKQLVANELQRNSLRSEEVYKEINCATIMNDEMGLSELFGHVKGAFTGAVKNRNGIFQFSTNGTLFLDELHTLDIRIQAMILRVVENGVICKVGSNEEIKTDVRLIAACQTEIDDKIKDRTFRADLYERLSTFEIRLPLLRERTGDVEYLLLHFLKQELKVNTIKRKDFLTDDLLKDLQRYNWPRNVRELQSEVINLGKQIKKITGDKVRKLKSKEKEKINLSEKISAFINKVEDFKDIVNPDELIKHTLIDVYSKFHHESPKTFTAIYLEWIQRVRGSEGGLARLREELDSIKGKGKSVNQLMMIKALVIDGNHFINLERKILEEINVIKNNESSEIDDQSILFRAFELFPPKEIEEIYRQDEEFYFDWDNQRDREGVIKRIENLLGDKSEIKGPLRGDFNKWKSHLRLFVHVLKNFEISKNSNNLTGMDKDLQEVTKKLIQNTWEIYPEKFDKFLYSK
jgi:transcriptional regulator with AAA-type ATPase domain